MPASDPMTALMAQLRAAAERTWRPNPKRYEGIGFFGVANMGLIYQRMESYRMRLPETLWPRAISIGVRTPDWVMEGLPETDRNREFASATYGHAMGTMGRVEAELVRILEAAGYRAGSAARLKFGVRGIEKMVARYAGLGWIGKSSLLVTPGAGPRAWWYVVLTDAPLPPSAHGPMERQCGTCTRCVRACPVRAFRDVPFRESDPLRARYREDYCGAYRNSTDPMSGCGRCVKVCPFGSRSSLLPASDRVEPAEHYDPATLPHGYRVVPPRPEAPQGGEYPAVVAVPALPETPGLIGRLLAVAAKTKAHFFGVADIAPALAAAEARGVRLALRLPRAVVFGIAMDDAAVDGLPESGHAYQTAYAETAWARGLSAARHAIGAELRAAGAQARPADAAGFLGLLKMAAHGAGLGWIGRNGLLVTPEVGPRLVLDALLTDAPLEPTARGPVENRCGDCRRCVDVCPVKAIGQPPPSGRVVLPVPFDAARCRKHCAELYGGAHAGCGLCVAACPFGRRRWYLPDAPELASRRQRGGGCHMNWRLARFSARAAVLLASVAAAVPWYLAVDAEPPLDRTPSCPGSAPTWLWAGRSARKHCSRPCSSRSPLGRWRHGGDAGSAAGSAPSVCWPMAVPVSGSVC